MITRKEKYIVTLEIDLELLAGELQIIELDVQRMTLPKLLEMYAPEKVGARLKVKVCDVKEFDDDKYGRLPSKGSGGERRIGGNPRPPINRKGRDSKD